MKSQDNVADPRQVSEAKHRERRKDEQDQEDLNLVMASLEGRRTLWRLLEHCGVFETVFSQSTQLHAYNTGRQDVGHFVMTQITSADPDAFSRMIAEKRKGEY